MNRIVCRPTNEKRLCRQFAILACLLVLPLATGAARGRNIERAFQAQAPKILKVLWERGYKTVGVLKFVSRTPDGRLVDKPGALYLDLARRLTVALILADDSRNAINILKDPNAEAAGFEGASHLSRAGLRELFRHDYELAWGDKKGRPSVFLTGIVEPRRNLRQVKVELQIVHRTGLEPLELDPILVDTDSDSLVGLGHSFLLRGPQLIIEAANIDEAAGEPKKSVKGPDIEPEKVAPRSTQVVVSSPVKPVAQRIYEEMPVELEVRYYPGRHGPYDVVPIEFDHGEARLREPAEGQTVEFVLRLKEQAQGRYGIVLKVNGVNTLGKERLPALQCQKWVLGTGKDDVREGVIRGFQIGRSNQAEKFVVKARPELPEGEVRYDENIGKISLEVFAEMSSGRPEEKDPDTPGKHRSNLEIIERAALSPSGKSHPQTLAAARASLRYEAGVGRSRGLVVPGERISSTVDWVDFQPAPDTVRALVITYFKP